MKHYKHLILISRIDFMIRQKKILIVFGTRPEAIKLAPLIYAFDARPKSFNMRICTTSQHRTMLEDAMKVFDITTHYDLGIVLGRQNVFEVLGQCLTPLRDIVVRERPDLVLVQGDTISALTATLAASYEQIPLAHVEAGLRTGNEFHPFPEESIRRLISHHAQIHFAPTQRAKENLLKEGIADQDIHVTGNTGIDALHIACRQLDYGKFQPAMACPGPRPKILVTCHRRENLGVRLQQICRAIRKIALRGDVEIFFPVHLNPKVREPVHEMLDGIENVYLHSPYNYLTFIQMMRSSYLILTDSGGIQEEAPSFGKPILILRDYTERPEAVESGNAQLVGCDPDKIYLEASRLLDDRAEYERRSQCRDLFGDGNASEKIAQILENRCM